MDSKRPIGVFDSGMGGLSVVREIQKQLPSEDIFYYGDNANAPYGEKTVAQIIEHSCAAVDTLLKREIKALVIACNTATSAAAPTLRAQLNIPVIGMEPALKPAQQHRHGGRILVLGTPTTLSLPKFGASMEQYGQGAVPVPVRGVVEQVQRGAAAGPQMESLLQELLGPYVQQGQIDAVVLGCTHYIFAKEAIARVVGADVPLVDGNEGTVRQLAHLLGEAALLRKDGAQGRVELMTSGEAACYVPVMRELLGGN